MSDLIKDTAYSYFNNKNIIYLGDEITPDSSRYLISHIKHFGDRELDKTVTNRKPISIYINSVGGDVADSLAIISEMERYKDKGIIIETTGNGQVASAVTTIICCGTKGHREISRYSRPMIHQISFGNNFSSSIEVKVRLEHVMELWEIVKGIYVANTTTTEEVFDALYESNLDKWVSASEFMKMGFVDKLF